MKKIHDQEKQFRHRKAIKNTNLDRVLQSRKLVTANA
jgi:hypothetical protein